MKRLLLTSASLLALVAAAPTASATILWFHRRDCQFSSAGHRDVRRSLAFGAQGGDGNLNDHTGAVGGKGAKVQGDFELTAGEVLSVVGGSGQTSNTYAGGGGGSSFVIAPKHTSRGRRRWPAQAGGGC